MILKNLICPASYCPLRLDQITGIPLTPEYNGRKGIEYQWNTEQGQFITWDNSIVSGQEKEITNDGSKIYWTVDFEEKEEINPFEISLKVIDTETGKTIAKTKIQIQKDSDGFYIVK